MDLTSDFFFPGKNYWLHYTKKLRTPAKANPKIVNKIP